MVASKMLFKCPANVDPPRHLVLFANQSMSCCFCALVQPVLTILSAYM